MQIKVKIFFIAVITFLFLAFITLQKVDALTVGMGNITIKWTPGEQLGGLLKWSEVPKSTETATMIYRIYSKTGYVASRSSFTAGDLLGTVTDTSGVYIGAPNLVYSYMVTATDSIEGFVGSSTVTYFHFIHHDLDPLDSNILREDDSARQEGQGQKWNFEYKLRNDAYITIQIYPPGTTFTKDSNNFFSYASSDPIKTVLEFTPRSYQMVGDVFINKDTWDCRDSSGSLVPNGLYYALLKATSPIDTTTLIDTVLLTIPVNIMHISGITATPITDTSSASTISYNVNGDCHIKVIICKPGTKFSVATSAGSLSYQTSSTYSYKIGDNLPLNPSSLAVDGTRILKIFQWYVDSGVHTFEWNGVDEDYTTLDSGIYVFAMSAIDRYDNSAAASSGNDYPIWASITINRQSSQPSQLVSLRSSYPKSGQMITERIKEVYAKFDTVDPSPSKAISISSEKSSIELFDPYGNILTGIKKWDGDTGTLTLVLNESIGLNGEYLIKTSPQDMEGKPLMDDNTEVYFTVNILSNFEADSYVYPNPIKNVNIANFAFTADRPSTIRLRIFNPLGELIADKSFSSLAGAQTYPWDIRNDNGMDVASGVYIYKLEMDDGVAKQSTVKKFILVK
ncbi:MAG: T9SS type A sorting domain-containing protein [bacterium]